MKKVLTIGGATQDMYLRYEGADCMSITKKDSSQQYMIFESGEKIEVDNILYYTGGGSTNSAVSFKRLGFNSSCFCKIGIDNAGKLVLNDLEKESVDISNILKSQKHNTGNSIIINSIRGERTIFAYRGANGFLQKNEIPMKKIKNCNQLYITSLSYGSANLLPQIVKCAKDNNVPVAINPGSSQLANGTKKLQESLKNIDIFILNSSEAKTFMLALIKNNKDYQKAFESKNKKTNTTSLENKKRNPHLLTSPLTHENFYFSINKFFKEVLKMGPKIIVVTNGANGVYVSTKKEIIFHPSIKTEVVDTLGAGDSFGSCFVASLLHGYDIYDALKNGIINSASVIGHYGAKPGLLTKKQLEEKRKKIKKNLIQKFKF
ncbi:carbohydrate kinase family protein [Candidatus Dependentiae bacterium]|nr:carbohydrate kinase family protein [Candidatus Dependentiae bacterium]